MMRVGSVVWEVRDSKGNVVKTFRARMYAELWVKQRPDALEYYITEHRF
jgi:hypothetical protein